MLYSVANAYTEPYLVRGSYEATAVTTRAHEPTHVYDQETCKSFTSEERQRRHTFCGP